MDSLFTFLEHNSIFIVLFIVLVVWTGIFLFLLNLDKRIKLIERDMKGEDKVYEK